MTLIQSANRFRLSAFVFTALIIAASHAAAGPVSKFTGDGDFVYVYGYDATGCQWIYVEASRSATKSSSQTWLYYDIYDYCSQQSVGYGSGYVPDTALKVSAKSVVLKFTPAPTAAFYAEGSGGSIALTFKPSSAFKQTYSGHSSLTLPERTLKAHGWWSYVGAQVSGTALTTNVVGLTGGIGESRSREMQIEGNAK